MALAQFLGNIGSALQDSGIYDSGLTPGFGQPQQQGPGLRDPFMGGGGAAPQQPAQEKRGGIAGFLGQPFSGTRDTLGRVGDFLLQANGLGALYEPRKQEHQANEARRVMGDQLSTYLGTGDEALANIMRSDPDTGMKLLKMRQEMQPKPRDPTALQQNIEYLRGLNPNMSDADLAAVAQYAIAAPRMYGSPETGWSPDPNYPFGLTGQAQQQPQAPQQQQTQGEDFTPEMYQGAVNALGQEGADAFLRNNGMQVTRTIGGQKYYQVGGKWYDNPEGL